VHALPLLRGLAITDGCGNIEVGVILNMKITAIPQVCQRNIMGRFRVETILQTMSISLYPENEPAQNLRIKRFFMSVSMYLLSMVPLSLTVYFGISPAHLLIIWIVLALSGNSLFYLAFRLGYNKRFKDPSLTIPQMSLGIATTLYTQIYAGPVRGAYLMAMFIIFVFGCYRLNTRQLLLMSIITSVAYAATIPVIHAVDAEHFDFTVELILWTSFSVFMPFLSVLAGSISSLRTKLTANRAELQGLLEKVTELATHDELTGLYNRRWLLDMLGHEKDRSDRNGEAFCVCLLDLDHFKKINDTYGHNGGDIVLKSFAGTTARMLRNSDFVARYGGEEFLLFLPQTSLEMATICIQRIRKELDVTSFEDLPPELRVTMSAGIAQYHSRETISELINRADQALYRAKEGGRNRTELESQK